jgi:hypothetical protein
MWRKQARSGDTGQIGQLSDILLKVKSPPATLAGRALLVNAEA